MNDDAFSIKDLTLKIKLIASDVQLTLEFERDTNYGVSFVEDSLKFCVANMLDGIGEGMREMFNSPGGEEFRELERVLEMRASLSEARAVQETVQLALKFGDESIFNGHKTFSGKKLAAMIEYLSSKGHNIYKTSLNKLLFYADLSFFYLRGEGISGSIYHHRRFGPVTDPADHTLKDLQLAKRVTLVPRTQTIRCDATSAAVKRALNKDERKLLDWVLETYGNMSAAEIVRLSHEEKAYKDTEPNKKIAYAYAPLLTILPPKSLLDQ